MPEQSWVARWSRVWAAMLCGWGCGDGDLGGLLVRDTTRPPADTAPSRDWGSLEDILRDAESNAGSGPPRTAMVGPDLSDVPRPRFAGAVHGLDGLVYFVPARARRFLQFDPNAPDSAVLVGPELPDNEWGGAALAANGRIYLVPLSQDRIYEFWPEEPDRSRSVGPDLSRFGDNKWRGLLTSLDDRLCAMPYSAGQVLCFDPNDLETVDLAGDFVTSGAFDGGVLAPDGSIIAVPAGAEQFLRVEPTTPPRTTRLGDRLGPDADKYSGGVLTAEAQAFAFGNTRSTVLSFDPLSPGGPQLLGTLDGVPPRFARSVAIGGDGRIYAAPAGAEQAVQIDPDLPGELVKFGETTVGDNKWRGTIVSVNGRIYAAPYNAERILEILPPGQGLPWELVLSPFFNRY
ncbi:MAG: hypothetical protein AAF735_01060 [Myxococcota bacterium]